MPTIPLFLVLLSACDNSGGGPASAVLGAEAPATCRSDPYEPVVREGATYEYRLADGGWAKYRVMEVSGDRARTEMLLKLPGTAPARAETEHPCSRGVLDGYRLEGLPWGDVVLGADRCVPEPPALGPGVTWSCTRKVTLDVDGREQTWDVREEAQTVDGGWVETPAGRWPTVRVTVRQEDASGKVWTRQQWLAKGVGTVRSDEVELVAYHVPEE